MALLEGGESWSTSALACATGSSQRSVQRALRELEETAAVRSIGRRPFPPLARAVAWRIRDNIVTPGFAGGGLVLGHE